MNKNRFFALIVLATLAVGCSKDNEVEFPSLDRHHINLFAESITSGSKVHIPTDNGAIDPSNASWVTGESINLNGEIYSISQNSDGFYVTVDNPPAGTLYSIYPATMKDAMGNDITVSYNSTTGCAIDIHSLAIDFHASGNVLDGTHDVVFPMAATAATGNTLYFQHLTGGLKLTLTNSTAHSVDRIVVEATQSNDSPAIYKDLKPSWATSLLPGLPEGEIGGINGDQSVQFISTMTFTMNTNGQAGVTIPTTGLTFCIPMLAKNMRYIQITGYSGSTQVFQTSKKDITENETGINIERNTMYTIPAISISSK